MQTNVEELKAEIETYKGNREELAKLANLVGFKAKEHPCKLFNGEVITEYIPIMWDGKLGREVFRTEARAKVHAMNCLVSRWG